MAKRKDEVKSSHKRIRNKTQIDLRQITVLDFCQVREEQINRKGITSFSPLRKAGSIFKKLKIQLYLKTGNEKYVCGLGEERELNFHFLLWEIHI